MVLGGTNPHKALVENLQGRGYYTILLDYLPNPPAAVEADEHIQESTLDKDKVLEIASERRADLVIATCIDQANVTACYVAEKCNLPHPYSYETACVIADKTSMKQGMVQAGIPTASFTITDSWENLDKTNLSYPLVVKPSDTNGSKGVRRADSDDELFMYLSEALALSRNGNAIVEDYLEGDEIGIDCFVSDGSVHVITMHKKRKPQRKDGTVLYSIGSISPPPISKEVERKIQTIAEDICKTFELKNTPLLIQVMVNGENVNVIEFAPRIGGGLNFRKIKLFAGFDILSAAVDSFLNKSVTVSFQKANLYYSENHIYTEPGIYGSIEGYQDLWV